MLLTWMPTYELLLELANIRQVQTMSDLEICLPIDRAQTEESSFECSFHSETLSDLRKIFKKRISIRSLFISC